MRKLTQFNCVMIAGITLSVMPVLVSADNVERRLSRVERMLENRQDYELVSRVEALQQEMQTLRGTFEELNHQIEVVSARQRNLYKDLDNRLARLSKSGNQQASGGFSSTSSISISSAPVTKPEVSTEVSSSPKASTTTVATKPVGSPQSDYKEAYQLLINKQYSEATYAFKRFLANHTGDKLIPNAHYWLGEIYLLEKNTNEAIGNFQTVITEYPASPKAGDSLLKLGYAYHAKGDVAEAKSTLAKVKKIYGGSTLAQLASTRLAQIEKSE